MVIAIDIRTFVTSQLTGVGIYAWEILNHLFRQDKQNQYKLFYNQTFGRKIKPVQDLANYPNVTLHYHHYPNKLLNFSLKYFHRPCLDELIEGCDIFWFPNLNFWQVSNQCKVILTVHDLSFNRIPWAYSAKMRLWHKLVKPREKFNQVDNIIAVSENTKNDLIDLYHLAAEKIKVVYPGVGLRPKTEDLKRINLPKKFILYLGTLEPRKNVEGVILALEKISQQDLYLVIAGGQGWLYQKIYKLARQSKVGSRIIFLNYVSPADRFGLYQKAQMLVWPSFYEGFGFPPLEAMSVGCPVITSSNSSLSEVVGEAALLVDPYNINEIAEAINQLLSNSQLRQNLVDKGYEQIKKYSWKESARKMIDLFNRL